MLCCCGITFTYIQDLGFKRKSGLNNLRADSKRTATKRILSFAYNRKVI